jgi:hypothetical protein
MSYQKSRRGQRRVRMAGLCYDTPSGEAMPFPGDIPDKPPCALSSDFYQEKLLSNEERFIHHVPHDG